MTANAILKAALAQFAELGFEGASLAGIAQVVGIKKQSIATYFTKKEELFFAVFQAMSRHYIEFLAQLHGSLQAEPAEQRLRTVVFSNYRYKVEHPELTAFYKRAVQFPPPFFQDVLQQQIAEMEQRSSMLYRDIFEQGIRTGDIRQQQTDSLLAAFYCLLDGIAMQMFFYPPEEFERRLEDIWSIFWTGIRKI
ncbi:TetR family transcriptional regulator [Paenibacillus albidus]|uniref:TetR family transcriptional regulator n=1 Tax=Paenibacillus albidus TaxID=2041023 RepID=A0A917CJP2_9BACL|nr:TetR/AcrR family transcriptional regulator [Paenibacillus albidus]GGF89623.1 TetR family transcriptional regulator [Paenibacillus albidus]